MIQRSNNSIPANVSGKIQGYALKFYDGTPGTEYRFASNMVERISRSAIDLSATVIATLEHNTNRVIGRTPKTLAVNLDDTGLRYSVSPTDTTIYRDAMQMIENDMVGGSSFGADNPTKTHITKEGADTILWIDKILVKEVAVVITPAYSGADVWTRSYKNFERIEKLRKLAYILSEAYE